MGRREFLQEQSLQTRQDYRLIVGIEQATILEMPEEEFSRLASDMENSPLFKRLYRQEKIVHYQRYPGTDISPRFLQFDEGIAAGSDTLDIESVLSGREDVVRHIQRIGPDSFKRYFLYPEPEVTVEEIAQECGLEMADVEEINALINEFAVMSQFYNPSALSAGHGITYSRVASVEKRPEGFVIAYLSPCYARGRYSIDYRRFEEMKESGAFAVEDVGEIRQLLKRLELINRRKDTMTRILQSIAERQALYFESGEDMALLPFSQKELAGSIGLVPSSVSRAISGRSLETPWGEERALKDFFPRPRSFRKELVRRILASGESFACDEEIRARLERDHGVSISRRSVASLRQELRKPPSGRRGSTAKQKRSEE
jgi:hypothetical protein